MLQRTPHTKPDGFSLIEVLVSLVILSVGLIGTAKFQAAVLKNSSDSQARSEAITIAQGKLEEFKSFESIAVYNNIESSLASTVVAGTNANYNLDWDVTENTSPDYLAITVSVAWSDSVGMPQQVNIDSIIGESNPSLSGAITL